MGLCAWFPLGGVHFHLSILPAQVTLHKQLCLPLVLPAIIHMAQQLLWARQFVSFLSGYIIQKLSIYYPLYSSM